MSARAVSPFQRTPPEVVLPELEVSVVLLEEEEETPSYGTASLPSITADVLAFLSEGDLAQAEEAPPEPPARKGPGVNTLLVGVDELLSLGDVSSALELVGKAEQLDPLEPRLEGARAVRAGAARRAGAAAGEREAGAPAEAAHGGVDEAQPGCAHGLPVVAHRRTPEL
ncbi:hypothetical protein ACN28S_34055 [Cystobacter fuscus]